MNTKQHHRNHHNRLAAVAGGLLLLALAATGVRAQTVATPPPPTDAPSAARTGWQADLSTPYAFRWHTAGIVGDVGGLWFGNFLGGELSYYDAREHGYSWYQNGTYTAKVPYREHIWTANLAYRYQFVLPLPGRAGEPAPLTGYVGGSAGLGWIDYYPGGANAPLFAGGPNFSDDNKGRFDAQGVAGLQWAFTPNIGLKVGYRYIWLAKAHRFYDRTDIDSGALEAGLTFRY